MKLKNLWLGLLDQAIKRFVYNFFVTGNARGLFYKYSHLTKSGKPKVTYNTKATAIKAAGNMSKKKGVHFSSYKCIFCDGYHIGRNKK